MHRNSRRGTRGQSPGSRAMHLRRWPLQGCRLRSVSDLLPAFASLGRADARAGAHPCTEARCVLVSLAEKASSAMESALMPSLREMPAAGGRGPS